MALFPPGRSCCGMALSHLQDGLSAMEAMAPPTCADVLCSVPERMQIQLPGILTQPTQLAQQAVRINTLCPNLNYPNTRIRCPVPLLTMDKLPWVLLR